MSEEHGTFVAEVGTPTIPPMTQAEAVDILDATFPKGIHAYACQIGNRHSSGNRSTLYRVIAWLDGGDVAGESEVGYAEAFADMETKLTPKPVAPPPTPKHDLGTLATSLRANLQDHITKANPVAA